MSEKESRQKKKATFAHEFRLTKTSVAVVASCVCSARTARRFSRAARFLASSSRARAACAFLWFRASSSSLSSSIKWVACTGCAAEKERLGEAVKLRAIDDGGRFTELLRCTLVLPLALLLFFGVESKAMPIGLSVAPPGNCMEPKRSDSE